MLTAFVSALYMIGLVCVFIEFALDQDPVPLRWAVPIAVFWPLTIYYALVRSGIETAIAARRP